MLHRLQCERRERAQDAPEGDGQRFVLHRHRDGLGEHLDLRLEQDGYLMGFRVDGDSLDGTVWGTVKAPHPLSWLEQDASALREDSGSYAWDSGGPDGGVLVLQGAKETVSIRVDALADTRAGDVAALRTAATSLGVDLGDLASLAEDGQRARERAVTRYCGLGRELDGDSFDEALWRQTLSGERLAVIQKYLYCLELRFDKKYPPLPVSRPEALPREESGLSGVGTDRALGILRRSAVGG